MGKNGNRPPVFANLVETINANVGNTVSVYEIMGGEEYGRNAISSYVYSFIKLGYLELIYGRNIADKDAQIKVLKGTPANYTSTQFKLDIRLVKKN